MGVHVNLVDHLHKAQRLVKQVLVRKNILKRLYNYVDGTK